MEVYPPTDVGIERAVEALRNEGVIAYPTETVYGLGADPRSGAALARLFRVKERDPKHPVLLIIGAIEQLDALTGDISPTAQALIDRFWPGPLSLLFRPRTEIPEQIAGPDGRICVRWTSCPIAQALCNAFGGAIVSTSANRSGEAPATEVHHIKMQGLDLILDGGPRESNAPSTVYDPDARVVLRQGAIEAKRIEAILQRD